MRLAVRSGSPCCLHRGCMDAPPSLMCAGGRDWTMVVPSSQPFLFELKKLDRSLQVGRAGSLQVCTAGLLPPASFDRSMVACRQPAKNSNAPQLRAGDVLCCCQHDRC